MEINSKKNVVIKIEIPEEDYKILSKIAKSKGYSLPNDYIREIIILSAEKGNLEENQINKELIDNITKRIERVVQDLLNPFTQKIDELSSRIADLEERIEGKEEKEGVQEEKEVKQQKKKTAMDVLKDQGVIFSDSVQWLRNPDAYFKKLESSGAIVLTLDNEKIALDKDYWNRFKEKLETIGVKDSREVEDILGSSFGENGAKLFSILSRKGMVYYDEDSRYWILKEK